MREKLQQLIERFVGKEPFSSQTAHISDFPFDDYFYSESKVPYLWFIKFLGLGKEKKPFYVYQLEAAIKTKRLL